MLGFSASSLFFYTTKFQVAIPHDIVESKNLHHHGRRLDRVRMDSFGYYPHGFETNDLVAIAGRKLLTFCLGNDFTGDHKNVAVLHCRFCIILGPRHDRLCDQRNQIVTRPDFGDPSDVPQFPSLG
ncbi:MAG: hypothetical protein MO846_00755 [Candidatus Devosia symbiotica]|nr:hypothetical protein [Candidatus Devosia symbiotica]